MNILNKPDQTPVTWTLPKFDRAEVLSAYKMVIVAFVATCFHILFSLPKFDGVELLSASQMAIVAFGEGRGGANAA